MYPDAQTAVEMKAPAMKLTLVIESSPDYSLSPAHPLLATRPLAEILEEPLYLCHHCSNATSAPLRCSKSESVERSHPVFRYRTMIRGLPNSCRTIYTPNRFIAWASARAASGWFRGPEPWAPSEPTVNLAKVCERYGGGGHARVGAISFGVTEEEAARKAAREIVEDLRADVRGEAR